MGRVSDKPDVRRLWAAVAVIVLLFAAALVWVYLAQEVSIQLLSFAGVILILLIGFAGFELVRPDAKVLTAVAVLSAVAVAGRILFAPLANFKPVGAIVIITGIVYGPFAGFMTGAISTLCSNMMFGQGAWTPWQMLGFGLVGLTAGILARRGWLKNRIMVCLFGAVAGFLYGIIVDSFHLLGFVTPTKEAILAAVAGGLLFSAIHAAANVFFLALFGKTWIAKLTRIRDK